MKINVQMLAFMNGEIRVVEVPDDCIDVEHVLDLVFLKGQNEFQPVKDRCSVSMGDVIEYDNRLYLIMATGFEEIKSEELEEYKGITQRDRMLYVYDRMSKSKRR